MSCSDWIDKAHTLVDSNTQYHLSLMMGLEICRALSYAHRNSILHRDIKPMNVFISKHGITKLGDFGIARYTDTVTRTHTVWHFRSPSYAAPEQWRDEKPTKKTDIYQLGCTLYHLFAGKPPFEASSPAALMNKHLTATPSELKTENPLIPDELSKLIVKCLAKDQDERPEIWQVIDNIAHNLQKKYTLNISFDKSDAALIEKIEGITDFNSEKMALQGDYTWAFADFNEAISEAFELLVLSKVKVELTVTEPKSV